MSEELFYISTIVISSLLVANSARGKVPHYKMTDFITGLWILFMIVPGVNLFIAFWMAEND